jgi:hypothetical protein
MFEGAFVQLVYAYFLLGLNALRRVCASCYEAILVRKGDVGKVLVDGRDPAVADEQALERPRCLRRVRLVAVEDCATNVGDVLSGIRFTGDI